MMAKPMKIALSNDPVFSNEKYHQTWSVPRDGLFFCLFSVILIHFDLLQNSSSQVEPHTHIEKETHDLIFPWLSWLVVLLVGVYVKNVHFFHQ